MLFDEVEELVSGPCVLQENTRESGCGGDCIRFFYAPELHAGVVSLDDDCHSEWVQCILDAVSYLHGETLLYLQSACEGLDDTSNLAEAGDLAVRDVGDVSLANERHHVVLAGRV